MASCSAVTLLPFFILLLPSMFLKPSEGLKMKLISPNNPESSAYLGNLTMSKRIERLFNQSKIRAQVLQSRAFSTKSMNLATQNGDSKALLPPVSGSNLGGLDNYLYAAKIGLGTFDEEPGYKTYLLAIDTASKGTWLQCEPCQHNEFHCFSQVDPVYPNSLSHSYEPLKEEDDDYEICSPQLNHDGLCYYYIQYADASSSYGQVAYETFTFETGTQNPSVVEDIQFGCGFNQLNWIEIEGVPDKTAGIMGLDITSSLLQQLDTEGTGLSFSYCFQRILADESDQSTTYLRFGDDINQDTSTFQQTPFQADHGDSLYHIKLTDMKINDINLVIDPAVVGDVIIDSGSSITYLVQPAYDALESSLIDMFSNNPNYRRKTSEGTQAADKLCYYMEVPEGYINLPTIHLIFEGADLEIKPEQGFVIAKDEGHEAQDYFCLMMVRELDVTSFSTIGAY